MPRLPFSQLPDTARLWVFGAAAPMTDAAADTVLTAVDRELDQWRAHGVPLVCARDWRDARFLAIAADEQASQASGCSIDSLFNALETLEARAGVSLLESGQIFWRDAAGVVQRCDRPTFRALAAQGVVTLDTPVFDTTVLTAGAWRTAFEKPARDSWHARLLGVASPAR